LKRTNNKKIVIWIVSITLTVALIIGGCAFYVSDYYRADLAAIDAFAAGKNVSNTVIADGMIAYGQTDADAGLIFYPGGKVEYTAYEPLMMELASAGVLCVLIEMPFHLAVLDVNAADGVQGRFPDVEHWYIGGHSLGGSMAASYLSGHTEDFEGIVLLGSYSTADLSQTTLGALSLYGSEDLVMNREKYDQYKKNLPHDLTEIEIEGGCHAYFGMYGKQQGDGEPILSADEQIRMSAACIREFILRGGK
jgi:hypothetical protein